MVNLYALVVRRIALCLSLLVLGTGCGLAAQGHVNSADEVLLDHIAGKLELVGPNANYWERVDFKQQSEESSPLRGGFLPGGVLPEGEAGKVVANDIPLPALESLTRCTSLKASRLKPIRYAMNFNVYVRKNGEAVSGYVASSTLSDRDTMVCLLGALRATVWPMGAMVVPVAKALIAQPAPVLPPPAVGDRPSGIYPKQPSPGSQPQGEPGGFRIPFVGVIRFAAPVLVGGLVFVTITLLPQETAPHWLDELNPITRRPYVSLEEYQGVSRLPPEEIQRLQQIRAGKSDAPAAPASTPSPQAQAQPAPQKQPECPRNEVFVPERTDNSTGCTDKNGNVRCYSRKHSPCAGVHTHGVLHYQEIRRGVCIAAQRKAVRCEGPFTVSGPCGSVPTVECRTGGSQVSGIHEE
ncbi:MAG TPA: hypothetical protein PK156_21955 [Polyangium sp.]|nr:hypothetical protein [Polyangium sp.]